jgi:hypothetical protein
MNICIFEKKVVTLQPIYCACCTLFVVIQKEESIFETINTKK